MLFFFPFTPGPFVEDHDSPVVASEVRELQDSDAALDKARRGGSMIPLEIV